MQIHFTNECYWLAITGSLSHMWQNWWQIGERDFFLELNIQYTKDDQINVIPPHLKRKSMATSYIIIIIINLLISMRNIILISLSFV